RGGPRATDRGGSRGGGCPATADAALSGVRRRRRPLDGSAGGGPGVGRRTEPPRVAFGNGAGAAELLAQREDRGELSSHHADAAVPDRLGRRAAPHPDTACAPTV